MGGRHIWLFRLLAIAAALPACDRVELRRKFEDDTPPGSALYIQNFSEGVRLEIPYEFQAARSWKLRYITTRAGRLKFNQTEGVPYYHTTPLFLFADTVVVTDDTTSRVIRLWALRPPGIYTKRIFIHALCTPGGQISVALPNVSSMGYGPVKPYEKRVMRAARHGALLLAQPSDTVATYRAEAGFTGTDTVSVAYRFNTTGPAGNVLEEFDVPVVVHIEPADAPCAGLLLADDTIRGTYINQLNDLLANDTFCPGYLDLSTFRILNEQGTAPAEFTGGTTSLLRPYSTYITSLDAEKFYQNLEVLRNYYPQFSRYKYCISTIGGVADTATITILR